MKKGTSYPFSLLAVILLLGSLAASGQAQVQQERRIKPEDIPPQFRPPHPADKMVQRYFTIDQKRNNNDLNSAEALPRSREFKRIDSTYYVGWMFEGSYKFNHAEDYLGFKNAIYPLARALDLLEHDYAKALSTRTGSIMVYYPIQTIQVDYTMIANDLMNCYSNTEQPDKVYQLLRRTLKWNLQFDFYMDSYNYLAWTVHRSRFYTHDKYNFLGNSIADNEALAQRYLDTAMRRIARNRKIDDSLRPGMAEAEKTSVYHYRNLLYSYSFQIDSAMRYFDLMKQVGRLPHNNFANFKGICGDFRTAEAEYKIASESDMGDHRLQEWAYYSSIIDIYKSQPKAGIELSRQMAKSAGATPGYGWYNIALARCLTYDGQVADAQKYADRAADFKEVHIGTTLGESQYEFSIQLLKLINKEQERAMLRFEHNNWWYNPKVLYHMSGKLSETYLQQFLIINQFAQNPERDNVIYKLFSTESTVSWDEIWYLVSDFSTQFFVNRFAKEAANDKRVYIRKYFQLFTARLKMKQGKYKEAKTELDALSRTTDIDPPYEKLFLARLYQAEAECARELDNTSEANEWLYKLFVTYPQLVPFTDLKMNMVLHTNSTEDKKVTERLKDCNINFVTNSSIPAANIYLEFAGAKDKKTVTYYVLDRSGHYLVEKQTMDYSSPDQAGVALAYRLFNVGGKMPDAPADTGGW